MSLVRDSLVYPLLVRAVHTLTSVLRVMLVRAGTVALAELANGPARRGLLRTVATFGVLLRF